MLFLGYLKCGDTKSTVKTVPKAILYEKIQQKEYRKLAELYQPAADYRLHGKEAVVKKNFLVSPHFTAAMKKRVITEFSW